MHIGSSISDQQQQWSRISNWQPNLLSEYLKLTLASSYGPMNLLRGNDNSMHRNQTKIIKTSDKYKLGRSRSRKWRSAPGSFILGSGESRRKQNTHWPKKYL